MASVEAVASQIFVYLGKCTIHHELFPGNIYQNLPFTAFYIFYIFKIYKNRLILVFCLQPLELNIWLLRSIICCDWFKPLVIEFIYISGDSTNASSVL